MQKFFITMGIFILLNIVLLIFYKKEEEKAGSNHIVFRVDKLFVNIVLFTIIFSFTSTIAFILMTISNNDNEILLALLFAILTIIGLIIYIIISNKKIVYNDKKFEFKNFGKKYIYDIKDLKKAILDPVNGMELVFKDDCSFDINYGLTNFDKIFIVLKENKVKIVNK